MPAHRGVLTIDQRDELNGLARDKSVDAVLALRARLVLWWDDGHSAVQIAHWAGVTDKIARCGLRAVCGVRYGGPAWDTASGETENT